MRAAGTLNPPRGMQLQLVEGEGGAIANMLVVANLGYLQFRAKPGVFGLEVRPGRGRDVFRLESIGDTCGRTCAAESERGGGRVDCRQAEAWVRRV